VNGGGAAPATLTDSAHLAAPLTDFSIGVYAIGTGNSANGFTPVMSSSPYVRALFNSLTINNGADAGNILGISSGSTTSQNAGVTFFDRGNAKWGIAKDPGNNFEIFDDVNQFQSVNAVPGGNFDIRSQGTGAVNFQDNPGSGTGGIQVFSGGATPVVVAAIDSTGQFVSPAGATITIHAGAPTLTCGGSPNGSGSLYLRTDGAATASTTMYVCVGSTWMAVTIP
jgi:hypothetical protein